MKIYFRYYAVLKPLQLVNIQRRGKIMLIGAWMGSVICSTPQVIQKKKKKIDLNVYFFLS